MLEVEVVKMIEPSEIPELGRRERAIARLRQKSDFRTHLFVYSVVNGFLVVIWLATGPGFFWPMFPMLAWGIGLVFHAWDVHWRKPISEEQIRHEMEHMA
jgi:2TM domain